MNVKQERRNNRKRLLAGCNLNVMVRDINRTRSIKKLNLILLHLIDHDVKQKNKQTNKTACIVNYESNLKKLHLPFFLK